MDFDVIIVGSGFGGAVAACRFAQAGSRVLVLERGRRWDPASYPRRDEDPWWWSNEKPELWSGWLEVRAFKGMAVVAGAGVGGGSQVYANISATPHRTVFDQGWPAEITWETLAPHYDTVGRVMNVQQVPDNQWPKRMHLVRDAAAAIGEGKRFRKMDIAVSFDPGWSYDLPGCFDARHSRRFVNDHGVEQGTCVHCGNCDIGCEFGAKNTLDVNYLALAENKGAEIRPQHLVTAVEPASGGYKVSFGRITKDGMKAGSATATMVVLAAGSLGSTELLLRCRDEYGKLPAVSRRLGHNWCSNGDFLTPAFYLHRETQPTQGPTITSAIDFHDRSQFGQQFWIQDGGFPNIVANWLTNAKAPDPQVQAFLTVIALATRQYGSLRNLMPWFAQGVDPPGGTFNLKRPWWLFGKRKLDLDWKLDGARPVIEAIVAMHKRLSRATDGIAVVPPSWEFEKFLITPHPLGGCNMADAPANGVVDHKGEVFGYRNLFVIDGAMVPRALGVNPSRTIAALAEHASSAVISGHRS